MRSSLAKRILVLFGGFMTACADTGSMTSSGRPNSGARYEVRADMAVVPADKAARSQAKEKAIAELLERVPSTQRAALARALGRDGRPGTVVNFQSTSDPDIARLLTVITSIITAENNEAAVAQGPRETEASPDEMVEVLVALVRRQPSVELQDESGTVRRIVGHQRGHVAELGAGPAQTARVRQDSTSARCRSSGGIALGLAARAQAPPQAIGGVRKRSGGSFRPW